MTSTRDFIRRQIEQRRERIADLSEAEAELIRESFDRAIAPQEFEEVRRLLEFAEAELEHWEEGQRLYDEEHSPPTCCAARKTPGGPYESCGMPWRHDGPHAWER